MRRLLSLFLIAFIFGLNLQHASAEKPNVVKVGYLNLVNGQLISKHLKYHEQEMGVPVVWIRFNSGRDVNTAMASGSIDFGNLGLPPTAIGIAGGLKYWGIFNANVLGDVEALVVRPEINRLKDLEGKTITCPFGSTTHYLLLKGLKDANVDLNKVKILDMAPGESVAPFIRGDIDAAYTWEPSLGRIVDQGGKILLTSKDMGKRGYVTWDIVSVQPEFAQKHPDLVKKFLKAEFKAIEFWNKHPEETAKIVAKELGNISVEDAKRMMKGTELINLQGQISPDFFGTSKAKGSTANDIVAVSEFLLEQGRIKHSVTKAEAESYLHPEFLEAVYEETK